MAPRISALAILNAALALASLVINSALGQEQKDVARVRVIVDVPAEKLTQRNFDERPAEFHVRAADFGAGRCIELETLEVVRVDRESEKAVTAPLAVRWYDDSIPYEFPECEQNAHATNGLDLIFVKRPRWGEFYNLLGHGKSGRLVWLHRQEKEETSRYAISFRLLADGAAPREPAPRGFVGDGSNRCRPAGASTTGMIHSRVTVADWNSDGLADMLIGGSKGQVLFYPNRGTRTEPRFGYAELVMADGKPLDVGWGSAPLAVDWDGDGLLDLLCGCERNRILYFHNVGRSGAPRLVNRGFLTIDGDPISLPIRPVPKSSEGIYTHDYYPVLDAVDWNGDGHRDLLAGGAITGRIFLFPGTGTAADGTPILSAGLPLETGGRPLNVVDWYASPCAADFDGDGDLDLMSGNMPLTDGGGDSSDAGHFLRYYENIGTRAVPQLVEREFPREGKFPNAILGTPRAVDFDADGVLDLFVSAGENVFLYRNGGTRTSPKFQVHATPLACKWGSVPLPTFGVQFIDWDGDSQVDLLAGLTIYRNRGNGDYSAEPLLRSGEKIDHPAPRGDGWMFTQLHDLDGDGGRDLMYGTHEGHLWLHRNLGGSPARFDQEGVRLVHEDNRPLHVGPVPGQAMDFDVLQGARTTFTVVDFNADGLPDLVVGDTYGKTRYYRNLGPRTMPRFAAPVLLGDLKIRMVPYAADWDGDGRPDVIGSAASGLVVFWRNLGEGKFADQEPLSIPAVPYSPMVAVVDWNKDGDQDLIVGTGYGYFCWFERSFLDRGYTRAVRH